jgi:CheY-like chemotaxis protein
MEAIGRLAGSVAHDFNNILAAILGGASLLEASPGSAEVQRVAREISTAASRGADLTRQLLTFGRRQPTDMQSLDVAEVVEHTLAVLRRLLDPAIELHTELAPGCIVRADRGMLDQVVMNLTLNARDAMPGGGTISLRVRPAADAPDRIELLVSDTGSGIGAEHLPHVFEPFFTTKPSAQGTGIGLATVYGIVTQHGGTVTVDSAPGEGARFRVLLPRVDGPAEHAQPSQRPRTPPPSRSILLLEDMDPVRNVIAQLLESQGHTVLQADTAAAARSLLAEHSVDMLLSDVALGEEQDGLELALELQRDHPELRVALMSGYPPEPERMRRLRNGVFLQKPFKLAQLDDALSKLWEDG